MDEGNLFSEVRDPTLVVIIMLCTAMVSFNY